MLQTTPELLSAGLPPHSPGVVPVARAVPGTQWPLSESALTGTNGGLLCWHPGEEPGMEVGLRAPEPFVFQFLHIQGEGGGPGK